jgi:hypothetical protein
VNIYSSAHKNGISWLFRNIGKCNQTTQRYSPEDSNLHIYHFEDLKYSKFFQKLSYRSYLNVIVTSSGVFRKILTGNSSLAVSRFQQVFHFVRRDPWRRRVPRGLSRGDDVQVTDFAETDMWHVWWMRNRVKNLRSRRIKTQIK